MGTLSAMLIHLYVRPDQFGAVSEDATPNHVSFSMQSGGLQVESCPQTMFQSGTFETREAGRREYSP